MDKLTLALIIKEGSRLITALLQNKDILFRSAPTEEIPPPDVIEEAQPPKEIEESQDILSEKATSTASGCVPCSIGHLGTCSGLLNEAMRFARKDGVGAGEVIDRINICLDELNALERVDLRPEMIYSLPEWEKPLAEKALDLSRTLRHDLEQISDVPTLERVSAKTQTIRQEIGKSWFKGRLSRMTLEQREEVEEQLKQRAKEQRKKEEN